METNLKELGRNIRELRIKKGLRAYAVAGELGVSKSTISRIENGTRYPSPQLLLKLAQYFDVGLDDLFRSEEKT